MLCKGISLVDTILECDWSLTPRFSDLHGSVIYTLLFCVVSNERVHERRSTKKLVQQNAAIYGHDPGNTEKLRL